MWTCNTKFHRNPIRIFCRHQTSRRTEKWYLLIKHAFYESGAKQISYKSIPLQFNAEMIDRWHFCQTPTTGFWLVVIEVLSVSTLWGGPQVSSSPIHISENTLMILLNASTTSTEKCCYWEQYRAKKEKRCVLTLSNTLLSK